MTNPDRPLNAVEQWLKGKTPAELKRLVQGGRIFYPDSIKTRQADNLDVIEETPVYLTVPNPIESADAKIQAIVFARNRAQDPSIRTEEQAKDAVGPIIWEDLDSYFTIAKAIRRADNPAVQYMLPELLMESVPRGAIYDLWGRVSFYQSLEEVRLTEMSRDTFHALVKAIAEKENLSPLVGTASALRERFIFTMAAQLALYQTSNSSSTAPAPSTPEPSLTTI